MIVVSSDAKSNLAADNTVLTHVVADPVLYVGSMSFVNASFSMLVASYFI